MPESKLPPIKGFTPSTLLDWEGKIACILFVPGCNFRCPFCHASPLVLRPDKLEDVAPEQIAAHVTNNEGWIDGAVICGGEPTIHEALPDLCRWLRKLGLAVKLDTNGARPQVVKQLIDDGLVDLVAMDVKAPFDERYHAAAGVECDIDAVKQTADMLIETGFPHEFRTTVCPAIHTSRDVLDVAASLRGAQRYVLQPFRPVDCLEPSLDDTDPMPIQELRQLAEACRQFVSNCSIRGDQG